MEASSSLKRSLSEEEKAGVGNVSPSFKRVASSSFEQPSSPVSVLKPLLSTAAAAPPSSSSAPRSHRKKTAVLPSVPSVSLLKEQVRSSAVELLGKQFDLEPSRHGQTSSGSCGDVFILPLKNRGVDANKTFAVKQQFVHDPSSLHDQAYRECRILLQLNHLRLERKCFNFVHLEQWFKSRPPLLFGANHYGDLASSVYMYFVLDFAQRNLFYEQRLDDEQFRLVLFQLLYALSVAQREFQFVHHDLHLKNVLLQDQLPGTVMVFQDLGTTWYVPGPLVKIADFGLARLRVRDSEPEEIIFNVRDSFSEVFSRDKDVLKLLDELSKKKPKNPSTELKEGIRAIRSLIRKSGTLREMLRIPYFAGLTKRPEGLNVEQCLFCSSDGDVTSAQRAAAGIEEPNAMGDVGSANGLDGVSDALLFESDKIELMQSSEKPATRSAKGEQKEYSVFSRSGGGKKDEQRDLVAEFFRAEEEREKMERQRRADWMSRQYQARMDDEFREELLRGTKLISEPLPSAAGRVKLGLTLDEARQQPAVDSFREASRLARMAEEQMKAARKKKRLEGRTSLDDMPKEDISSVPPTEGQLHAEIVLIKNE